MSLRGTNCRGNPPCHCERSEAISFSVANRRFGLASMLAQRRLRPTCASRLEKLALFESSQKTAMDCASSLP